MPDSQFKTATDSPSGGNRPNNVAFGTAPPQSIVSFFCIWIEGVLLFGRRLCCTFLGHRSRYLLAWSFHSAALVGHVRRGYYLSCLIPGHLFNPSIIVRKEILGRDRE